ncbi:DUF2244 domain-containing protein [Glaciecola sp. 1036]|uniref:DUF2244 domain-containing protein n=1 Tax=Alteromonadaceae TaxID=72275 RepID=UPI003CFBD02A
MVVKNSLPEQLVIELSPNRSATWQQTKWVIWVMVAVVMVIAVAWSFVGAWVVLPFAGLEVGLFALLMYKVSRLTYHKQTLYVTNEDVIIEQGFRKQLNRKRFIRQHLHVAYWESERDWELPRIALINEVSEMELGSFLNLADRKQLKTLLEEAGFIILRNRWWQS